MLAKKSTSALPALVCGLLGIGYAMVAGDDHHMAHPGDPVRQEEH